MAPAEPGVHSPRGRHRAPCSAPAPDGGHGYPQSRGRRQCPLKARPTSLAFILPLGLTISSYGFGCTRAGSCLWDYSLEGGPLPQRPTLPQGTALWGGRRAQGVPCPPKSGRKSQSGSSRGLAPVTAPCQHLPAEPAQMLQECGSATTRYCRNVNAGRVGKGREGALLPPPSPSPSKQLPMLPV